MTYDRRGPVRRRPGTGARPGGRTARDDDPGATGGGGGGGGRTGEAPVPTERERERDRLRDPEAPGRRRRPDRLGDLLPDAARRLGLEDELRFARAITTWDALVAERVPPAVGACRLLALESDALVVAADEPIVAAELRMRALELLDAFAAAPGGRRVRFLRLVADPERGGRPGRGGGGPRL